MKTPWTYFTRIGHGCVAVLPIQRLGDPTLPEVEGECGRRAVGDVMCLIDGDTVPCIVIVLYWRGAH